jgi:hypothetical protein
MLPLLGFTCLATAQPAHKAKSSHQSAGYVNMTFQGHFRAGPKTHHAKSTDGNLVPTEDFDSLTSMRATLLPDQKMRAKYPNIGDQKNFPNARFPEELRNVSVVAFIHAVKLENGVGKNGKQADLDFHLMLGDSAAHGQGKFFTAEVSGLPPDGVDVNDFKKARQQLVDLLKNKAKVQAKSFQAKFAQINPPIKAKVTGSLFFDGDHVAGAVGPAYAKASSVWEIHPVISIEVM